MKFVIIAVYLARFAASCLLRFLNLRHLEEHGAKVPEGFAGAIDSEALAKSARYTVEQSRVGLLQGLYDAVLLLAFLFTPLLPKYDGWIASLSSSFVIQGVLFMVVLTLAENLLDIPFSLYTTFRLERRYGFNTTTPYIWITDFLKSTVISVILLVILVGAGFLLVEHSPGLWWLWVWCFFALFTLTMMYVSPYLIEPLFSKFEPLQDPKLEDEIRTLLEKGGLRVKGVMQMDASRRSLHSNAYFTGIGRVKRIVLYDTLIKQMERPELLAILAHEAGHWKKGHIWKRLVVTELVALITTYAVYRAIGWGGVPPLFGLPSASFPAQMMMIAFLLSIAAFPLTPVGSWLSRLHEWQADAFSSELTGAPGALARALIKLSKENLANLHPHPLFATFYYSHPPVVARVARLLKRQTND